MWPASCGPCQQALPREITPAHGSRRASERRRKFTTRAGVHVGWTTFIRRERRATAAGTEQAPADNI